MNKPKLYLNPNCPRFESTPKRKDGSFDKKRFAKLLEMQHGGSIAKFVKTLRATKMDTGTMLIRPCGLDEFETHPDNAPFFTDKIREMFDLSDLKARLSLS
jgi:hypothetical protein